MRRVISILLAFIYLLTTSGIVISTHYCMGKVAGYALGQNDEHLCGVCGMSNEGCCHDDLSILKVKDDHQLLFTGVDHAASDLHTRPVVCSNLQFSFPTYKKVAYTQGPAPPLLVDRLAMFCVFRI